MISNDWMALVDFKVGDFVETNGPYQGIIYKIDKSKKYGECTPYVVLFLFDWCDYTDGGCNEINSNRLTKLKPTAKLNRRARYWVKDVYNKKWFDNLTFIEISARLREYEQELIRD